MNKLTLTGIVLASAAMLGLSSCNSHKQNTAEQFIEVYGTKGRVPYRNAVVDWELKDDILTTNLLFHTNRRKVMRGVQITDEKPYNSIDEMHYVKFKKKRNSPYKVTLGNPIEHDSDVRKDLHENYSYLFEGMIKETK